MAKSENTEKTGKRPAPKTAWQKGQSGNPGGRPKNQQSITYWLNEFGNMTPEQLAELCDAYAKELRRVKGGLSMFAHIAVRTLMAQINEPAPGLLAQILDRTEGKVAQPVELSWRDEAKKHGLDPDALAAELFAKVGDKVSTDDTGASAE